ncbi:polymorphic toxin type 27 domain-containing protein [Streptomyces sp. NBC_00576]|uniref:polymorphic toxin type 27 domain-containing protein n=1 Tax=Streptomyces sp. NBC_00576 TaxID=2903665 RepID=UPI002E7FDE1E|nr:polymorphic toxin type 27 domain-containing protein [Streptomyces sp. NBC_00576]WUB72374.1 polymorphic toxin type 27 domain-containing protein [Streptomyces sp. NBC_00576]
MSRRPVRKQARRPRRLASLATSIVPLASLALLATVAVQPASAVGQNPRTSPAVDSYDGFDAKAAEQLRFDQCLMADGLRRGGPNQFGLASTSLPLPADQLHQKADRTYGTGAFAVAWQKDSDDSDAWVKKTEDTRQSWSTAVSGLDNYPGAAAKENFFDKTGLLPWLYQSYFKSVDLQSPFYDPSPQADDKTKKAALAIGDPLYTSGGTSQEQEAWKLWKKNSGPIVPNEIFVPRVFADDARVFLASGGFPRTAPAPGTPEFRIAVEDLKTRFASCAWHGPIDPDRVLGKEVAQASAEWQQEIASQATQRSQILAAGNSGGKALQDGAFALGKLLGQSWIADYSTRWLDYYTEGGFNWIGDGQLEIQVPGAAGKCIEVTGAAKTNGTPVQINTCSGGVAQKWQLWASYDGGYTLQNPNSGKCLEVLNGGNADGTKIQIRDCGSAKAQQWKFDVRSASPLVNAASGKCLHLPTFDNSKDAVLSTCNGSTAQKFRIIAKTHTGSAPAKADVDKAKAAITAAQAEAKKQLAVLKTQLETAKKAVTASDTALQAAYGIADTNGAPRGRGLLVGLQKNQVTKGAAAALQALEKAGETAEAATRASAGDSATIAQRALAQAAQSKAEFRKEAAEAAELQAKAAADAAKVHRDNAKKDKETAEAKLAVAVKAEGDAKAAAADAHAKRLAAEAEEKTAKAEKENAAARQAEAAEHRRNAESEATKAKDAKDQAEAAKKTAESRRDDAVNAKDHAKEMRDDAWDAEQKADAARAKADAKQAYVDSLDAGDAADAARAAANDADKAADNAEAAAGRARSEADAATRAAAAADAAATRAEAAAKRARSDADAAQAAKLRADAAVRTATSAAADAITASQHAASEAKTAVQLADEAERHAKDARTQADGANKEAGNAVAAAAKAAGFAHVTAQAAADAGKAAQQVAAPANDAIELGSAYVDADSAAGLVVLTGQSSKTIAEQQQAVADAHAKNAVAEADAAKNLADQAKGDAKEAYTHAANAAKYAADARTYSKEALGYAADAAKAAAAAQASLARTIEYDRQAAADAAAADKAAGNAEGYAKDARDSADAAALDAEAARSAAAQAEQDAKDARAAADRAAVAATEAEQAAKDADAYAKEAEETSKRTETKNRNDQLEAGTGGVDGVFYKTRAEPVGDPEILNKENCNAIVHVGDCVITANITSKTIVDIYLCTATNIPDVQSGCPATETLYIDTVELKPETEKVTYTISALEFNDAVAKGFVKALTEDFVGCWDRITTGGGGTLGNCGWAVFDVALLVFGNVAIKAIRNAVTAFDAAMRTGIAIDDAWRALRAAGLTEAAIEGLTAKLALTKCFPAGTKVATEDGPKSIEDIEVGDRVWSQDQVTGKKTLQPVLNLFNRTVDSVVRIITADGQVESTDSHRFWVRERGWVEADELRAGDTLEPREGSATKVLGTAVVKGPVEVFNFEVARNHTYYVYAGSTPVLVHNECLKALADNLVRDGDHIVLGINPYSETLARGTLGGTGGLSGAWARTFNHKLLGRPAPGGDGRPIWMVGVEKALDNRSVKLSISLDGVVDAKTAAEALSKLVERGKPLVGGDWQTVARVNSNNGTAWEVATLRLKVILGRRDFEAVDWYFTKPGDKAPSLVKDMPTPDWAQ